VSGTRFNSRFVRRRLRDVMKAASMRFYVLGDRVGWHVVPKHYYTANHDIHWLRHHRELWARPANFDHLHWNLDEQFEWLEVLVKPVVHEVEGLEVFRHLSGLGAGPGFGPIESQALHGFIRTMKPARVVELGAGVSSLSMLHADKLNIAEGRAAMQLTCVEPYPWPALEETAGLSLLREPAQAVDRALFDTLHHGDLLFIDSSHAVKVGSEVPRIYLEIIPNLAPGVYVHIHDNYFPYLYPPDVLESYLAWQESTLLLALLTANPHLEVLCCMSALHDGQVDNLKRLFPDFRPQHLRDGLQTTDNSQKGMFPASIYLRTK
jgi:hypothetical protein